MICVIALRKVENILPLCNRLTWKTCRKNDSVIVNYVSHYSVEDCFQIRFCLADLKTSLLQFRYLLFDVWNLWRSCWWIRLLYFSVQNDLSFFWKQKTVYKSEWDELWIKFRVLVIRFDSFSGDENVSVQNSFHNLMIGIIKTFELWRKQNTVRVLFWNFLS